MKTICLYALTAAFGGLLALGCGKDTPKPAQVPSVKPAPSAGADGASKQAPLLAANPVVTAIAKEGGWGTIKGKIVFDGEKAPEQKPLTVDKDQAHCLAKGPVLGEAWVVNPKNKGVQWVLVFLKQDPKMPLPVHAMLKNPPGDAILDQPQCAFVPHVLAMRSDQTLVVKNPAPVSHTATIKGFKNDFNPNLAPGAEAKITLEPERNAIQLTCGHHPWMRGYLWVMEHPYFAVTDAEGNFEIKYAPSGPQRLVIWQESLGWLGGAAGRDGRVIQVQPDAATDLGSIKMKPAE